MNIDTKDLVTFWPGTDEGESLSTSIVVEAIHVQLPTVLVPMVVGLPTLPLTAENINGNEKACR